MKTSLKISTLISRIMQVRSMFKKNEPAICGLNNVITNDGSFENVKFDIVGNDNIVLIATGCILKNVLIYIRGNQHRITIKNNCIIGAGELWLEDNNGSILIEELTTIEDAHLAVTEPFSKIVIKRDCMLAKGIEIRTGDSHSIIDSHTGNRINPAANVCIEEHVWIGAHAKILKGVTIGQHSIVATNCVVTKSIGAHCIVAGVPAKVIRDNVSWKRERIF